MYMYFILQDSSFAKCVEVGREYEEEGERGLSSLLLLLLLPGRKQKEKEKCSGGNKNGELGKECLYMYMSGCFIWGGGGEGGEGRHLPSSKKFLNESHMCGS